MPKIIKVDFRAPKKGAAIERAYEEGIAEKVKKMEPYIPKTLGPTVTRVIDRELCHGWRLWCMVHGIKCDNKGAYGTSRGFSQSLCEIMARFPVTEEQLQRFKAYCAGEIEWYGNEGDE